MLPSLPEAFERTIAARIQESQDWLSEVLRVIEEVFERERNSALAEVAHAIQERRGAILSRLAKEAHSLMINHGPEIAVYLQSYPRKRQLFEHILRFQDPPPAKPPSHSKPSFTEIDGKILIERLEQEGIRVNETIVWADGLLLYRGQLLKPEDEVGLQTGGFVLPMLISQITTNEMRLKNEETGQEIVATAEDLNDETYLLLV
jgi:hypothetical protein